MGSNVRHEDAEVRRVTRFEVSYFATGEHKNLGKIVLPVVNISATGIMVNGKAGLERGDIVLLRLPSAEDVRALCLWTWHQLAGLQFDRPLHPSTLTSIVDAMRAV